MSSDFVARKRRILQLIDVPEEDYKDLSPIGAIDPGIRQLVHQINALDGFVTTSSCAGRIAVYSEVQRGPGTIDTAAPEELAASIQVTSEGPSKSGKGGGEWLYVSHEPVKKLGKSSDGELATMLGFSADNILGPAARSASPGGLVRFKFEPFILHILTSSLGNAQHALSAAMSAGFRESGISGVVAPSGTHPTPMVAVRTAGLAFDSIVAQRNDDGAPRLLVPQHYLRMLVEIANQRFVTNQQRIDRFREALLPRAPDPDWEPSDVRKERKRQEGLRRQAALRDQKESEAPEVDLDSLP